MNFYDAHNHLQDEWLAPHRTKILADLANLGVRRVVVNGTCETDWPEVASLCSQPSALSSQLQLIPSYGLQPWDAGNRTPDWQQKLLAHLDANPRNAIGEIGLDRWILDRARPDDPRLAGLRRAPLPEQIEVFAWQLALAAQRNLPASIHCLDAFGPLYDVLRALRRPARGFLLHAFSGSAEMAESFAALGAYFSFNGSFLTPRFARLRELYAALPLNRLLVETDAPAMRLPAAFEQFSLPPAADGSPLNHPANLAATYTSLAKLRELSVEDLAAQVEKNFQRLFGA